MRILFCQTVPYLPQDHGGGLTNTHALCTALKSRNCEVAVLCQDANRALSSFFSRPLGLNDKVFDYPVTRARDPLGAVDAICRSFRPDIAVVQFGDVAGMVHALNRCGVPALAYLHDTFSVPSVDRTAAAYAACSNVVAAALHSALSVDAVVMPVLIDREAYLVPRTGNYVTFVNPIPRKGIEIVFSLAARRPDIRFQFIEAWHLRGRVRNYLRQRIAYYGNISLVGPSQDMRPVYHKSRLILAPSLWVEAWGRVVSEAQVSGIPALASDSGGLPEAVGEGGTIVARDASISEWSKALDALWSDTHFYETKSAAALAHSARPEFALEAIIDRFLALLQQHHRL
ncbi:glycosyltransferase [Afipia birgiae]|uniref:glycosyltransferase n=1 Tax=Afipia birgiae TaxID=151414 RepID=UPI0003026956|nr:glycosyltransferase [Afipia birgiae]